MRYFKKIKKPLCFLILFVLINMLLTFLLTPYSSPSSEMWDGFYKADMIDAVYIGTSQCYESVNPEVTNEITGDHAYNMGTNGQPLTDTALALETAFDEREIHEVVLVLDYDSLMKKSDKLPKAEACFRYAMNRHLPLHKRIGNTFSYILRPEFFTEAESINYFIPWVNNRSNFNVEYMFENAKAKLTGKTPEAGDLNNVRNAYGYKAFYGVLDYNEDKDLPKERSFDSKDVSKKSLESIDRITELCNGEGARLIVVAAPVTKTEVLTYGDDYFKRYEYVKALFHANGVAFYDFNLAKEELYQSEPEDFKDWIHFNDGGAKEFSAALARLQMKLRAGEDCEDLFYDRGSYPDSLQGIDSVRLKLYSEPGGEISGEAIAYMGTAEKAEYEFYIKEGKGQEVLIRAYDESPSFTYRPKKQGLVTVRVNVRRAGSADDFERYRTESIEYWLR